MPPIETLAGDEIPVAYYPDQTPIVTSHVVTDTLILRPTSVGEFVAAMFWCDAQRARGHRVRRLVLPLVPGSRQDRLNPTGDALFSLRSFADMINARGFDEVAILDPHSDVAPALIANCRVWTVADVAPQLPTGVYGGVIAPDVGAAKRAQRVADVLRVPFIQATKTRDLATGHITAFSLPNLQAVRYLVVDDICDGGATFLALADAAHLTALDLYVTHGLFTKGTAPLIERFHKVYCTDSTIPFKSGVTVLPITHRMCYVV